MSIALRFYSRPFDYIEHYDEYRCIATAYQPDDVALRRVKTNA